MQIKTDHRTFGLIILYLAIGFGIPFIAIVIFKWDKVLGGVDNIFLSSVYLLVVIGNFATLWKIYIKKVQIDAKHLKFRNSGIYVNALLSGDLYYVLDKWNKAAALAVFLFLIYLIFRAYRNDGFFKRELRRIGADSRDYELYDTISVSQDLKARMTREYTVSAITFTIASIVWFVLFGLMLFSNTG